MPSSPRRARLRRALRALALLVVVLLVVPGALLVLSAHRDPTPYFLERRSRLAAVHEGPEETVEGHRVRAVRLTAESGLQVELLLKRPVDPAAARRPLAVLLGGHNTGREAVRLVPDTRGAVVAALAYPYRGEHRLKGLAVVRHVPAIRRAILDTPPAVMLALDYLAALPDVDPQRIEAVGVSLGAPFVVIAGALDPRIRRVWAVHGSAGAYEPLEHNLRRRVPQAAPRAAVAGLASLLVKGPRMAPERWAPRIAPRPFVMVNALHDQQVPRPLVQRLYESAGEPKSLVWLPGGHVRARPEVVRPLVDTVLGRMLGPR
jgi:fermentation-respiration switch protein FrsA (DUF1100 family)